MCSDLLSHTQNYPTDPTMGGPVVRTTMLYCLHSEEQCVSQKYYILFPRLLTAPYRWGGPLSTRSPRGP